MNKVQELIFYNVGGNGDLHVSREYCKYFIDFFKVPAKYAHLRGADVLIDLNCEFIHINDAINMLLGCADQHDLNVSNCCDLIGSRSFFYADQKLFINTWPAQKNMQHFLQNPGNTPYFRIHYSVWSELCKDLQKISIDINLQDYHYYIPTINFSKLDVERFFHLNKLNVFLSNGPICSMQSSNFDFDRILHDLAKEFQFCNFYLTSPSKIQAYNVIDSNEIYKKTNKSNLNELAYLSTFCDIIIGRSSGPDVFTLIRKNIFDSRKTYICFANEYRMANPIYEKDYEYEEFFKVVWQECRPEHQQSDLFYKNISNTIKREIKIKYFDKYCNS